MEASVSSQRFMTKHWVEVIDAARSFSATWLEKLVIFLTKWRVVTLDKCVNYEEDGVIPTGCAKIKYSLGNALGVAADTL